MHPPKIYNIVYVSDRIYQTAAAAQSTNAKETIHRLIYRLK